MALGCSLGRAPGRENELASILCPQRGPVGFPAHQKRNVFLSILLINGIVDFSGINELRSLTSTIAPAG